LRAGDLLFGGHPVVDKTGCSACGGTDSGTFATTSEGSDSGTCTGAAGDDCHRFTSGTALPGCNLI
jgi:hypothetical protein